LGEGCASVVKVCVKKSTKREYAVKIVRNLDEEMKTLIMKEFKMVTDLPKHKGVAKQYEVFFN
jgi:hypothetical protein